MEERYVIVSTNDKPFSVKTPSLEDSKLKETIYVLGRLEETVEHFVIINKRGTIYLPKISKQYRFVEVKKEVYEEFEAILFPETMPL